MPTSFKPGQRVKVLPHYPYLRAMPASAFIIVVRLNGADCQSGLYLIRGEENGRELIVAEENLERLPGTGEDIRTVLA